MKTEEQLRERLAQLQKADDRFTSDIHRAEKEKVKLTNDFLADYNMNCGAMTGIMFALGQIA